MERYTAFETAKPVWLKGLSGEKNITAGFYARTDNVARATLKVATSGFFRVFVDGAFVHYGPARCAHGFFRVDEVALTLGEGVHHVAVDVVCYGVNSYAIPLQDAFVIAELRTDHAVLAATGAAGFDSFRLTDRVQKIQRYSFQRPFAESYRLSGNTTAWRVGELCENAVRTETEEAGEKALIPRYLAAPHFPKVNAALRESIGTFATGVLPQAYWQDRSLTKIAPPETGSIDGYVQSELEMRLSDEACEMRTLTLTPSITPYSGSTTLSAGEFEIFSMPCEKTGLIGLTLECAQRGTVTITFDETLRENGDVDPLSMGCVNIIRLDMTLGQTQFLAMEPMSFKYIRLSCVEGAFTLSDLHIREVICPQPITASCVSDAPEMRMVFDAALETFRQNSFDIFMDCPSRERAGWLCDSFFTGRAEYFFTGASVVERNFLENFLLPESFPVIDKGMLPMCYPSDHYDGNFIPNWAMWLVLELREYAQRSGDTAMVEAFRPRIGELLAYFKQYENADGLLEKLPRWVFVEWSRANDLVQDINFPSNMLYASMLDAAAELYGDAALYEQAAKLREIIRARSFNGQYFTDNEVYQNGVPVSSGEITETCQYYAFFTNVATPETHPELWNTLLRDFGPERAQRGLWPEIWPANAFIGNFLRLDLLLRHAQYAQLERESAGYFLYMAEKTGTLWENVTEHASCNHGFASYAAVLLDAACRHHE